MLDDCLQSFSDRLETRWLPSFSLAGRKIWISMFTYHMTCRPAQPLKGSSHVPCTDQACPDQLFSWCTQDRRHQADRAVVPTLVVGLVSPRVHVLVGNQIFGKQQSSHRCS